MDDPQDIPKENQVGARLREEMLHGGLCMPMLSSICNDRNRSIRVGKGGFMSGTKDTTDQAKESPGGRGTNLIIHRRS